MSRTYQALRKAVRLTSSNLDSSTNGMPDTGRGLPEIPARLPGDIGQALADLLQNKLLTHSFGVQGEWEVRTTLVDSRQAWRYRSRVLVHGKEVRRDFPPIDCDRTPHLRQAEAVTEDMFTGFAREAVQAHFTRCARVAEHVLAASISSQPPPWHLRMKTAALVLFSVAALVTAYWWWKGAESVKPEQPYANQPERSFPAPQLPAHWIW